MINFKFVFNGFVEQIPTDTLHGLVDYLKNYRFYDMDSLNGITIDGIYKFPQKDILFLRMNFFYYANSGSGRLIKYLENIELEEI